MDLLIHTSDCVSISHLEFGEILVFSIESLLKVSDVFLWLLQFLQLLVQSF